MTDRDEEAEKQIAQRETKMSELRSQIVRAENWDQIFTSHEEEMADFLEHILGEKQKEYEGTDSFKKHVIEHSSEGDIHILRTKDGGGATFQKLNSTRDVVITFSPKGGPEHRDIITYDIGNIRHNFTASDLVIPNFKILEQIGNEKIRLLIGMGIDDFDFHMIGKPATKGWEDNFLYLGYFPQRIGHRIYANFVLEAQRKFAQAYPQLMPAKTQLHFRHP